MDDNKEILRLVNRILRPYGDIEIYDSPTEASERIQSVHYELAILDEHMPRMKGSQLAREIKHEFPLTYVISMSGLMEQESYDALMQQGVIDDFIPKPFDATELLEKVQKGLKVYEARVNGYK